MYEDRLLDRSGMYRLLFLIAAFYAVVNFVTWLLLTNNLDKLDDPKIADFPFGATLFFVVLWAYARAKLKHIATIRRHRSQIIA